MKLIVGLGNPGEKYRFTRHNVGFMIVDRLSGYMGVRVAKKRCFSLVGEGSLGGLKVVLAKPRTYMNLSGLAVSSLVGYYRVDTADLLVVCDDLDLPFGRIRLRAKGGPGGHRGLESIIAVVGSSDFPRLRVGIGKVGDAAKHVLGGFSTAEKSGLAEIMETAAAAVDMVCRDELEQAMSRFNGWRLSGSDDTIIRG
jgi:PTH1 family peptidyl-tRNA hydrolase